MRGWAHLAPSIVLCTHDVDVLHSLSLLGASTSVSQHLRILTVDYSAPSWLVALDYVGSTDMGDEWDHMKGSISDCWSSELVLSPISFPIISGSSGMKNEWSSARNQTPNPGFPIFLLSLQVRVSWVSFPQLKQSCGSLSYLKPVSCWSFQETPPVK